MNRIDLPDDHLWAAVREGDSGAFVILYNRYWNQLYRTAQVYLKDSNLAEEVVQDVFIVLWNRRNFLNIEKFKPYITVTLRYHIFKQLKAIKVNLVDYVEEFPEERATTTEEMVTEKLQQGDFEIELMARLSGLPKRCAEIFILSRVKNLSNFEIAGQLGISKFTVENQITHALKYLREKWKR